MSSTTPTAPPDPPADATPQDIETDIQASRERLASSVDALTAKLDVKGQAKQKARETSEQAKQMARETSEQAKQKARETSERVRSGAQHAYEQTYERARTTSSAALGALAAGVAGLVVLLIAVRRWSSRRS
jgi:F0F1-type ATP synthase membrane subunit b/b'